MSRNRFTSDAIERFIRILAEHEGVRVATESPVLRNDYEDALYVQFRIDPLPYLADVSISARALECDGGAASRLISKEFASACARGRGAAVASMLERPVEVDKKARSALCERLATLVEVLARGDAELCERLAVSLMTHAERLGK